MTAPPIPLSDGDVLVASQDGSVRRVGRDGHLRWQRELGAPVVAGGAADAHGSYFATRDGTLHSLDTDGQPRWQRALEGPVVAPLLLDAGALYTAADGLYAHDTDGRQHFHHLTADRLRGAPARHPSGLVVFGTPHGRVRAVGLDGELRWEVDAGAAVEAGVSVAPDGSILVANLLGDVLCLDATGAERWRHHPEQEHAIVATPAVDAERVVLGGGDGLVRALSLADGSLLWSLSTAGPVVASARLDVEGVAYVGSRDDRLYAIGRDGALRFRYDVGQDIDSTAALAADGTLYVGADHGALYAFSPDAERPGAAPEGVSRNARTP